MHCPESNLKLASGFCPVARLRNAAGVNVALGTDGAASNNDLDMFAELRTAALLGKGASPTTPRRSMRSQVLEMATLGGARAVGLADEIGSLEARQVRRSSSAVDLGVPSLPADTPSSMSQLVYSASRDQVCRRLGRGQSRSRDRQANRWQTVECLPTYMERADCVAAAHRGNR